MNLRQMLHRLVPLMLALMLAVPAVDGAKPKRTKKRVPAKTTRTVDHVRKEQSTTQKRLSETATRLQNNDVELNKRLGQLNSLNADIRTQASEVNRLRSNVDSINARIRATTDTIGALEHDLESLRTAYARALRQVQPSARSLDAINFLFAASTWSEAWNRMRYLRRFGEWRTRKAAEIDRTIDEISTRRQRLAGLHHSHDVARRKAEEEQRSLQVRQDESKKLVASLRKEDSRLRRQLAEQQKRAKALDRELDRLIAEEQARIAREEEARRKREAEAARRKQAPQKEKGTPSKAGKSTSPDSPSAAEVAAARAATKKSAPTSPTSLSGSFSKNKGKLLFPVSGSYKIVRPFGRQAHPTLPHVTVDNSGIDIETTRGASARAVFGGTVSAIFKQPGFNTIVMVRHGSYLTVYAGLSAVSVSKGQSVKAGQTLGTLATDPDRNVGELHFEIRNERTKLNPASWVK